MLSVKSKGNRFTGMVLLIHAEAVFTTFMFFMTDAFAKLFIQHQLDAFLLLLRTLLLGGLVIIHTGRRLEDLRLQFEQLIQGDAIFGILFFGFFFYFFDFSQIFYLKRWRING